MAIMILARGARLTVGLGPLTLEHLHHGPTGTRASEVMAADPPLSSASKQCFQTHQVTPSKRRLVTRVKLKACTKCHSLVSDGRMGGPEGPSHTLRQSDYTTWKRRAVSMVLLSKSRLRVLVDSFFFFLLLAIRTLALHDEEPVRSSDKSQLDRIWLVL
ncbi:hypothetical protein PGTUg99_032578 [Puccinia graminis f. sp. tritici]|uniref:Uncharacterized protein n=1 Tax=Puccinia graminis f. sp. tritici TaxID=56615 RepID=A0A5B0R7N1_PUCGR|nr:hypothetical protein PGTUg99_032578 [Puccinia graminis f. sp. tritici]